MARPESQAIAGYFPTPEHLVPAIASLVALERERYDRPILFDPCAGTGAALVTLAGAVLDLAPADSARYCLGIELEVTRAEALARRLPHGGARSGDAFTFGLGAAPGASVLFLNPPYDTDREHRRLEQRFLARFTDALAPGGALVFVVPHAALAASAELLASRYARIGVWRFPDPDFAAFKQVVVVAERRAEPVPADRMTLQRLRSAAEGAGGLPELPPAAVEPALTVRVPHAHLTLHAQTLDVEDLLARARPFEPSAALMGFDREARKLLGSPLPVALPPRPAHIALALAAGLLNGRCLAPNDGSWLPHLLAKGTFTRTLQTVDHRRNSKGEVTGEVCVQQPRLDLHILRLDTLAFQQLALGTEPSGAPDLDGFNTADLLEQYSDSLARLVREQLPALHDPDDPAQQIALPALARRPYRRQAALIQAGLKLLALGENPQLLAEVGTGKSTVALSIAGALAPERIATTAAELARVGFDARRLRPVLRTLIVCPPHLLQSWTDQAQAVLPEAAVQIVRAPSDLDRPAAIYVLSRETAKLGSSIAGVRGPRCPECAHPLPEGSPETFAAQRLRCQGEVVVPSNAFAHLARDLGLVLQRSLPPGARERILPFLEAHPALHRRAAQRIHADEPIAALSPAGATALRDALDQLFALVEPAFLRTSHWEHRFWEPFRAAAHVALVLDAFEPFAARCRALATRRMAEMDPRLYLQPIEELLGRQLDELAALDERLRDTTSAEKGQALRADLLDRLLDLLLAGATWSTVPGCGAALHATTPEPRRFPLARYILSRKRRFFDLVILDEAHEFSTSGSAQQKAAHRLVQLPGVPVIALTGSLMGGYASSLFANAWALSRRFRAQFELDEKPAFVTRYGYRKLLVTRAAAKPLPGTRSYGRQSDRTDGDGFEIRQLGEAPGVLPLYILEHVLPTGLVMHKGDLDEELPPCTEEPTPVHTSPDDFLDAKLLAEFNRLRSALVAQIQADRGSERAGLLWGAMSELPSYLDLANEECGEFVLAYPEEAGGEEVARGIAFPASWRSPKERWLLAELASELAAGRRAIVFLRHTGNRGFVRRLQRLIGEELGETPSVLDPAKVATAVRERWLDHVIADGCRVLLVHPKAVQTGLNNLTAFHTAIWYEGPDYDARVTRQANGRPHRIGQTEPVRLIYPFYAGTLQKAALDLVARKITASLQVDGLSLAGALEAAGALSEEDRLHATAALAIGQALYRAATGGR
jgi:hypothetical protein